MPATAAEHAYMSVKMIVRAAEALKHAKKSRIHVFLATSPLHMEYKLNKKPDEVLKMIDDNPMWNLLGFEEQMVKFAKDSAKRKLVLERFEPLKGLATLWKDDFVKRYADKEIGV